MSEEIKEYPFDVKFDESALKTFNDLIKEKGIRHFKLESDLYGILDVVSYEEYEKLQQKVEQLEKENKKLNNIIDELENTIANFIENHTESYIDWKYDREIYLAECNILQKLCDTYFDKLKELKENNKDV